MAMIRLYNVIDIRTGQFHSVAVVSQKNVKWFVPAVPPNEEDEEVEE
jgi:hypothetical protein